MHATSTGRGRRGHNGLINSFRIGRLERHARLIAETPPMLQVSVQRKEADPANAKFIGQFNHPAQAIHVMASNNAIDSDTYRRPPFTQLAGGADNAVMAARSPHTIVHDGFRVIQAEDDRDVTSIGNRLYNTFIDQRSVAVDVHIQPKRTRKSNYFNEIRTDEGLAATERNDPCS